MVTEHNFLGNCWDNEIVFSDYQMNDICNTHKEPRGDCSECPDCPQCDIERDIIMDFT